MLKDYLEFNDYRLESTCGRRRIPNWSGPTKILGLGLVCCPCDYSPVHSVVVGNTVNKTNRLDRTSLGSYYSAVYIHNCVYCYFCVRWCCSSETSPVRYRGGKFSMVVCEANILNCMDYSHPK